MAFNIAENCFAFLSNGGILTMKLDSNYQKKTALRIRFTDQYGCPI